MIGIIQDLVSVRPITITMAFGEQMKGIPQLPEL
jgi:hypothetical protein